MRTPTSPLLMAPSASKAVPRDITTREQMERLRARDKAAINHMEQGCQSLIEAAQRSRKLAERQHSLLSGLDSSWNSIPDLSSSQCSLQESDSQPASDDADNEVPGVRRVSSQGESDPLSASWCPGLYVSTNTVINAAERASWLSSRAEKVIAELSGNGGARARPSTGASMKGTSRSILEEYSSRKSLGQQQRDTAHARSSCSEMRKVRSMYVPQQTSTARLPRARSASPACAVPARASVGPRQAFYPSTGIATARGNTTSRGRLDSFNLRTATVRRTSVTQAKSARHSQPVAPLRQSTLARHSSLTRGTPPRTPTLQRSAHGTTSW